VRSRVLNAFYDGQTYQPSHWFARTNNQIHLYVIWTEPGDPGPENHENCTSRPADRNFGEGRAEIDSGGWHAWRYIEIHSPESYVTVKGYYHVYEKHFVSSYENAITRIANEIFDQIEPYAKSCQQ